MDLRLPYALGVLAGLAHADAAHSAALEVPNRLVDAIITSTITIITRLVRTSGGLHSIRSGRQSTPTTSADACLLCTTPVGITPSVVNLEAFAETVWFACGCTNRNEFQSTALLAAAMSIGISTQRRSHINTLQDAIDVVDVVSPHGEEDSDTDMLEVAQHTLKTAANTQSDLRLSPTPVLQETLSGCAPSNRIVPLAFFLAASPQGADKASKCFTLSGLPALYEAVAETLSGAFAPSGILSNLSLVQCSEDVHINWLGIAGQLLELYPPAPIDWIRRALGDAIPRVPRRGLSPFEASESGAPTYADTDDQSADEPRGSNAVGTLSDQVIIMSEPVLRLDRRTKDERIPTGAEWSTREGVHLTRLFPAMCAARAMGVEVVSLSPTGGGPRASIIAGTLAHEGVIDAGPRIIRCNSGFASLVTTQAGGYKNARISSIPEDAWDEVVRTLGRSDVPYIDANIEDNSPVLVVAEHALIHLPRHVRVVLDVSGAFIGPRSLPNDNVLVVLGQESVEPLGTCFMSDRTAFDTSRVPAHAAGFILSLFHYSVLISTTTYKSFLARPRRATDEANEPRARFHTPAVMSTDHDGTYGVWTGALASALTEGSAVERSVILANYAGALASTMPGLTSCPTCEQIEASARALPERDDVELERRIRASGALTGVVFGDAIGVPAMGMPAEQVQELYHRSSSLKDTPTSHPAVPEAPAGALTAITSGVLASLSALLSEGTSPLKGEVKDRTGDELTSSRCVLHAIPVDITIVTTDSKTFAEAVQQAYGNKNLTRQELRATAFIVTAISLGIDKKSYRASGIVSFLQEVINYVAGLPPRGSASSRPDVLQATCEAIGIVLRFSDDVYERLRKSIGTSANPAQSAPAASALVNRSESHFAATNAAILGGETGLIAAISGAIQGAICGITMFSPNDLATVERVSHPGVAPLAERLVERRVHIPDDAASN